MIFENIMNRAVVSALSERIIKNIFLDLINRNLFFIKIKTPTAELLLY